MSLRADVTSSILTLRDTKREGGFIPSNFVITAAVAYNSNPGALDNLEKLVIQILGVMPNGYVVGDVQRPTITNINTSSLLIADLSVSTYFNQDQA